MSPFAPRAFSGIQLQGWVNLPFVFEWERGRTVVRRKPRAKHLDAVVRQLFTESNASVIVVKRGTHGATVYTKHGASHVPAYRTSRIWKIGSGDVFAAMFANCWAVERDKPHDAAMKASAAAAIYCENQIMPLPKKPPRSVKGGAFHGAATTLKNAAGWTTSLFGWAIFHDGPSDGWSTKARRSLQHQGIKVFSPLHDVGRRVLPQTSHSRTSRRLRKSQACFVIIDGVDSGTLFEVGYATALPGIPAVAFCSK